MAPPPWWQVGIIAAALVACALAGRIHSPALRFALVAAAAFVALRLMYRVLFAPVLPPPENAVILLSLPALPLSGPFSGISLFGVLTLEQAFATLVDASRFAVVFVVFGAANALADARTLLARAPRRMLPLATVLSLALGGAPALLTAAKRVGQAARIRGERRGPQLIVPVFEQAVERATVLGASMELRGFGAERTHRWAAHALPLAPAAAQERPPAPVLRVHQLTVAMTAAESSPRVILHQVSLTLHSGELTIVQGATGSGKSTLLAALAGLVPSYTGGAVTGTVELLAPNAAIHGEAAAPICLVGPGTASRPALAAGRVALVPQRVEHSFVAEHVRGELSFALSRRGFTGEALDTAVAAGLARFGLQHLEDRQLSTLSAGEATRVAIAAASLTRPQVLLLDEPVADLDPQSVRAVEMLLADHLAGGGSVLIAEHRPELLDHLRARVAVRGYELAEGRLREGLPASADGAPTDPRPAVLSEPGVVVRAAAGDGTADVEEALRARALRVERGGRVLLTVPELTLRRGEITIVTGPNGSGKTSLLEDLERAHAAAAMVPHRVDDLLIRDSIEAECRFADRRARAPRGSTAARFTALIAPPAVPPVPGTHPRDASADTRLALGIAVQLAREPRVLMLDEPTRGLDGAARLRLAALCAALASAGTSLLLTTHDREFPLLLERAGAHVRRLQVSEGALV